MSIMTHHNSNKINFPADVQQMYSPDILYIMILFYSSCTNRRVSTYHTNVKISCVDENIVDGQEITTWI